MQHPTPHESATPPIAPAAEKKRPWLPLRHMIGLLVVALFITAGVAGGAVFVPLRASQLDAESAARSASIGVDIYSDMSIAMLENDREAFLNWGEGAAREQLARIWDETKKIGWTVGLVDSVYSEEELSSDKEYDPQRPKPSGMLFAFDLGFTQQRFADGPDGPLADCVAGEYGCGILTQSFEYDVTVDGGDGNNQTHRIIELAPRTPMPWDDPDGVHVVRGDHAVVFGYADEARQIDAIANDTELAAAGVLATEVARSGYSDIPGFPAFYTEHDERYQEAVYGVDGHANAPNRDWEEAGVSVISPPLDVANGAVELATERGMLLEMGMFGGQSGALPVFNGQKIGAEQISMIRVAAHEFAHALEMTTFSHMIFGESGSDQVSFSFGTEGYARYVEDLVASPHDGVMRTMAPQVQDAVLASSNQDLRALVGAEAFRNSATSEMAYNASGNYFAFLAASGADISEVMRQGEYMMFDPYTWIGMHYPSTAAGGTVDGTPEAWRSWNAR